MDMLYITLAICSVSFVVTPGSSYCLSGCSCINDDSGRSLHCMETTMAQVPADVHEFDFTKIRIENSHLTELAGGAFSKCSALASLWLSFNDITLMNIKSLDGLGNLTELRLQGNKLRSVPWTAFQDTPKLNILDLQHNRLDALPEFALRYLPGLTYLDLSFNQLTVISQDVFLDWPLLHRTGKQWGKEGLAANVMLALHDNPWLCDCRLKGFVEFIRAVSPPLVLVNSYLACAGPTTRAGKIFHELQLKTCTRPVASAPETNMTLPLGANATLVCLGKARPDPAFQWMYSLKIIRGFAVTQTRVDEDTLRSQLLIPSLHLADRGLYTCTAINFLGNSSASVVVNVGSFNSSLAMSPSFPLASPDDDERVAIDVRIAKQTVYGISLEWSAATEDPAETWFTVHFGKYDSPRKEAVYIGPGISSYSVGDLAPVTKYEVCVTLRNQPARHGQCVVFVTGSDVSELEQRERLIHIVVIVCAMVLSVPAGMYACTTDARFDCFERCAEVCRRRRLQGTDLRRAEERRGTFDSLQAASDEALCADSEESATRRRSEERSGKAAGGAQLY